MKSTKATSGSNLFSTAQVGPIDIGPEVFANHLTSRLTLNVDSKGLAARLPICNVGEVRPTRFTTRREHITRIDRETHEIGFELFHAPMITAQLMSRNNHTGNYRTVKKVLKSDHGR